MLTKKYIKKNKINLKFSICYPIKKNYLTNFYIFYNLDIYKESFVGNFHKILFYIKKIKLLSCKNNTILNLNYKIFLKILKSKSLPHITIISETLASSTTQLKKIKEQNIFINLQNQEDYYNLELTTSIKLSNYI